MVSLHHSLVFIPGFPVCSIKLFLSALRFLHTMHSFFIPTTPGLPFCSIVSSRCSFFFLPGQGFFYALRFHHTNLRFSYPISFLLQGFFVPLLGILTYPGFPSIIMVSYNSAPWFNFLLQGYLGETIKSTINETMKQTETKLIKRRILQ